MKTYIALLLCLSYILSGCSVIKKNTITEQHATHSEMDVVSVYTDSVRNARTETTSIKIEYYPPISIVDTISIPIDSFNTASLPLIHQEIAKGNVGAVKSVEIVVSSQTSSSHTTMAEQTETTTISEMENVQQDIVETPKSSKSAFSWVLVVVYILFVILVALSLLYLYTKYHR